MWKTLTWKLNSTLINNPWSKMKSKEKLESILNENENRAYHNMWSIPKTVPREKYLCVCVCLHVYW